MKSREMDTEAAEEKDRKEASGVATEERAALFAPDRTKDLRMRWAEIQAKFVDDPRAAVMAADKLVDEVVRDLTTLFDNERSELEGQLKQGDRLSTEDLRLAVRRYRSFFERLLAM